MSADTSAKPPGPPKTPYVSKDRRPVGQQRPNFIPQQNWLAYNWIDKDPELDFVIWAIGDSGWSAEKIELETEKNGHRVSRYTVLNWVYGDVKRPQNASMNNVMSAIGYSRTWTRQ
jgi:hypothetical protein